MTERTLDPVSDGNRRLLHAAKASACGKAIIAGEHAVVYGAQAVAIPLKQMRMQVELLPGRGCEDNPHGISLKLGGKEVSQRIGGVVTDALAALRSGPANLRIAGKSSLPFGAGLGSSATLCIVILRALAKALGLKLSKDQLAKLGNLLEARFHGNPSGLDTAVVAYEECISFRKNHPIKAIPVCENEKPFWHFALIDSGIRASTLAMIKLASPFFRGPQGDARIAHFDTLSETVASGLVKRDVDLVAAAISETGKLLEGCGIVTNQLKEVIDGCKRRGVLAAKTTGAGGGGAILALLDPKRHLEQFQALQEEFGSKQVFAVSI